MILEFSHETLKHSWLYFIVSVVKNVVAQRDDDPIPPNNVLLLRHKKHILHMHTRHATNIHHTYMDR